MGGGGITIAHAIPGRIRVKVPRIRRDPSSVVEVVERLRRLPGVERIEVNRMAGSVTVLYDENKMESGDPVPGLSEVFGATLFPDTDIRVVESRLRGSTNGSAAATPLATRISGLLGKLDRGMGTATGGTVDLRMLLPLGLFLLAIALLASPGSIPMPTWYDLLWASFGTFVALNGLSRPVLDAGHPP